MNDFEAYNPTRILFGKDQLHKLGDQIRQFTGGSNILLVYGGGSIKSNGIYDKIIHELKDFELVEFGGVEANPEFDTLMEAVSMARVNEVDFILAVGGGSVIDGVKFISGAIHYDGDPWDVLLRNEGCTFKDATPFGTVLTIPATGSEANSGAVISRKSLKEKRTMGGPQFFPKFSFCDPTVVYSLPPRQIANGITDAYVHVLEQYLTFPTSNKLQERQAEAILSTLLEIGPSLFKNPENYDLAANLMWCATNALNGSLRSGVVYDWATHMIGHELTALYEIDHARTLAIILPRLYSNQFEKKKAKLVQYGTRVLNLTGTEEQIAREAIVRTEAFFQSLEIKTKISDYAENTENAASTIRKRMEERSWNALGENGSITPADVEQIVLASI